MAGVQLERHRNSGGEVVENISGDRDKIASTGRPGTSERIVATKDFARTSIGLAPTSPAESPQHLHDEQGPSSRWHESRRPEDDVRRHFRDAVKHIMRQPHGADFVLYAAGRMAWCQEISWALSGVRPAVAHGQVIPLGHCYHRAQFNASRLQLQKSLAGGAGRRLSLALHKESSCIDRFSTTVKRGQAFFQRRNSAAVDIARADA
jgi:hypothetical protein